MNCCRCGQSALGIARDGKAYCHRRECIDWKADRILAQQARDRIIHGLVTLAIESRRRDGMGL